MTGRPFGYLRVRAAFSYFEKNRTPSLFCGIIQSDRKTNRKTGKEPIHHAELEKIWNDAILNRLSHLLANADEQGFRDLYMNCLEDLLLDE